MTNIGLIEFCESTNNIMMSTRYRRALNNNGCHQNLELHCHLEMEYHRKIQTIRKTPMIAKDIFTPFSFITPIQLLLYIIIENNNIDLI